MHSGESATNIASCTGIFTSNGTNNSYKNGGDTNTTAKSLGGICIDFGKDEYHNNVTPCIVGYSWIRTA